MSHYVKITLHDEADAAAIEHLRRYRDKAGGESAAARKLLLRGLGVKEPLLVDEQTLRRLIREECASQGVFS